MYETSTPLPSGPAAAAAASAVTSLRSFPPEYEAEFAETQAGAPQLNYAFTALGTGLLFHGLLIAERHLLGLDPRFFLLRGGPATLGLLALLLVPARWSRLARVLLCVSGCAAVIALAGNLPTADGGALFPLETGLAALILLCGWTARLPLSWSAVLSGSMFAADLLALAWSRSGLSPLALDSLFAPAFAVAFVLLTASVRREEARRSFLSLRAAAFAGTEAGQAEPESRHLDPITGVGSREAFDMRLRAAWEQATSRRNSVALLMVSLDDFAARKRQLGDKYADALQVQVAGMLKQGLRRSDDMVARFDVHHFVVMLPGVGSDGATQIAERLRGCIEELAIYANGERHRATVTIGVASLRAKRATSRERLVECAAQALEQAKQTGPNLVCVEGRGCLPRMA